MVRTGGRQWDPERLAALLSFALAAIWWPRIAWIINPTVPALVRAALLGGCASAQIYVLWTFRGWLGASRFRAADFWTSAVMLIIAIDLVAQLNVVLSGAPGFRLYKWTVAAPYSIVLGYPHVSFFVGGITTIALGYSLLRFPSERGRLVRAYAYTQIAAGAGLASISLSILAVPPAIAGHGLVGLILVGMGTRAAVSSEAGA